MYQHHSLLSITSYGEEAAPNARVWRIYRDRATEIDTDLIEGWYDTLNMVLIFVRLLCAAGL